MPLEILFEAANYAVLPFWFLLFVMPRWSWTRRLVHGPVVVLLFAPIYAYLLFGYGSTPEGMNFRTLYGVMVGFSVPHLVMAGWIHYLIFDLFIGAWESRDAIRRGIPHAWVLPCLIGTLMFGPLGLLLYVIVRFFKTSILEFDEAGEQ
jgi:hypothetical protein